MQFNIVRPDRAIEPALRDKIENLTKPNKHWNHHCAILST